MRPLKPFEQLPSRRWRRAGPILGLILAACGEPVRSPTPTAAATPPAATPASPPTGHLAVEPGGAVRFSLVPSFSRASYRAREQLRGINFPTEAVGSTRDVTGTIILEEGGAIRRAESRITLDLRTLRSDEPIRDNFIQENTLQTGRFSTAEFQPSELRGVPRPIPTGADVSVQLLGELTVHRTTRPVTWVGSARLDDVLTGAVSTRVTITEFGMALPSVFRVLTLEDALTLEIAFQAKSEVLPAP